MKIKIWLSLLLPLVLLILNACNSQISNYQSPSVSPQEYIDGYPVDENNNFNNNNLVISDDPLYPSPGHFSNLPTNTSGQSIKIEPLKPSDGKASISGMIYSFTSKMTLPDTKIFLTKALGDENAPPPLLMSPDESVGDVIGRTDMNGEFQINNIPPGNYYLIVWGPDISSIVVNLSAENYSPLLFTLQPNEKYNLGILNVSWP